MVYIAKFAEAKEVSEETGEITFRYFECIFKAKKMENILKAVSSYTEYARLVSLKELKTAVFDCD